MTTDSFSFTGSVQNWVCPPGVTSVIVEAIGAGGGSASLGTATPGKGGRTRCRVTTTPGTTYYIYVGGKGGNASGITGGASGSNSGRTAIGGAGANYAGGGGGSTDFRTGTNENDRIVVAPGGGGAGAKGTITPGDGGNGGDGGNPGTDGANGTPSGAGAGGLKASGGTGGTGGYFSGTAGGPAGSSGGYGGNGASFSGSAGGGGGGGGGYAGGGGGGANTSGPQLTGGGGGGGGSALTTGIESLMQPGANAGDGWLTITYGPAEHCTVFEGIITDVSAATNVQLSVASSALPDPLSDYEIVFFGNTTGNPTPGGSALSAGPWTIGAMGAGNEIHYYVYRPDGAHIDGSAVMRATDVPFGLYWDVTVECPGGGGAYQFRRGRRAHIAGARGVSIQGR